MEFDFFRILFAFISGYFLCLSGSLSQLTTNNQLASPSTLGMDGLAVLNILIATVISGIFLNFLPLEYLSLTLFFVALTTLVFFLRLKRKKINKIHESGQMKKVILAGLTFNLFVGAIFSIIQFIFMALNLEFPSGLWFGNFKFVSSEWLLLFVPLFFITQLVVVSYASDLEKLNLGASFAKGLGVNVSKLEKNCLLLSVFLTGVVISFFGVFSFLGLVFPHIIRSFKIFEKSIKGELLVGSLIAGFSLCFIDWLCFNLTYQGAELPVGMVSGVIGSFFLIVLVVRAKI